MHGATMKFMSVVSIYLYDPGPKFHFPTVKSVVKACIKTVSIKK